MVHVTAALVVPSVPLATLVHRLAQFVHSVRVGAIIRIRASFSGIKVFAHHCLVIFEVALIAALIVVHAPHVVVALVHAALEATTSSTTTAAAHSALEPFVFHTALTAVHVIGSSGLLGASHAATTAASAHGVVARAASRTTHEVLVPSVRLSPVPTAPSIAATLVTMVLIATIATTTTAAASAKAAASAVVVAAIWIAVTALVPAAVAAKPSASIHATSHDSARSLSTKVVWDWIVDIAQLLISMRILTMLIVLTVALVFIMSALLCFKSLIDLSIFNGTAHDTRHLYLTLRLLLGLLVLLWLAHHLLLLHIEWLMHLLWLLVQIKLLLRRLLPFRHRHRDYILCLLRCIKLRRCLAQLLLLLLPRLLLRFITVVLSFLHPIRVMYKIVNSRFLIVLNMVGEFKHCC